MPRIRYVEPPRMGAARLEVVERIRGITREYAAAGFRLTLRQLFYRFVSRAWIPNTHRSYKNLGETLNVARMAGLVDWDVIEDRTRAHAENAHWTDPAEIVSGAAAGYGQDTWEGQNTYVEVWVEKDALGAIVGRAAAAEDVAYFACKGYTSQSAMWRAARRIEHRRQARFSQATTGDPVRAVVLHLGDHDPSGVDMTRDIEERLEVFGVRRLEVRRIALNMDQVEEFNPPPNPTKFSDSRCAAYVARYGLEAWELDALEPQYLMDLIQEHVRGLCDLGRRALEVERQEEERAGLEMAAARWPEVAEFLEEEV